MHPASPNGQSSSRKRIRIPRRAWAPASPELMLPSELTRWRVDLLAYLGDLELVVRRGAGEAYVKRRLEGLLRAVDNRLEQARRRA